MIEYTANVNAKLGQLGRMELMDVLKLLKEK